MTTFEPINYVEYPSKDPAMTRSFFETVFGWRFQDYGPDYTAFFTPVINGGFFRSEACSRTETGGALLVLYSKNLERTLVKVQDAGAEIVQDIFSFPGGRRFHFVEPGGNELAVWSDEGL